MVMQFSQFNSIQFNFISGKNMQHYLSIQVLLIYFIYIFVGLEGKSPELQRRLGHWFGRAKNMPYMQHHLLKGHKKGCHECVCNVCEETFNHENKLKRHKDKTHRNSYRCDHCQKTFSEKRNLTRHTNSQHKQTTCATMQVEVS